MGFLSFTSSIASGSIEIILQLCILISSGSKAKKIMTLSYLIYGIGLMAEPYFVVVFERNNFFIIGVLALLSSGGYLYFESPEKKV